MFNLIMYFLSSVIGMFSWLLRHQFNFLMDKNLYALSLIIGYIILYFPVEKKIRDDIFHAESSLWLYGNPFIKTFTIKLFILITGSGFIFLKYSLYKMSDYIIFSMVVCFFIGSFFESVRLLKRSK